MRAPASLAVATRLAALEDEADPTTTTASHPPATTRTAAWRVDDASQTSPRAGIQTSP